MSKYLEVNGSVFYEFMGAHYYICPLDQRSPHMIDYEPHHIDVQVNHAGLLFVLANIQRPWSIRGASFDSFGVTTHVVGLTTEADAMAVRLITS